MNQSKPASHSQPHGKRNSRVINYKPGKETINKRKYQQEHH